jgi:hypothetical protein
MPEAVGKVLLQSRLIRFPITLFSLNDHEYFVMVRCAMLITVRAIYRRSLLWQFGVTQFSYSAHLVGLVGSMLALVSVASLPALFPHTHTFLETALPTSHLSLRRRLGWIRFSGTADYSNISFSCVQGVFRQGCRANQTMRHHLWT